jgi:hypothetical protein
MINRTARLAQQFALLLLFASLLSASVCPSARCLSYLEPKQSALHNREQPSSSKYIGSSSEVSVSNKGTLTTRSFPAVSNQKSTELDYLNEASTEGFYRWPVDKLPLKVFFQPSDGVPSYRISLLSTLRSCFDEWADASKGKLAWVEVADPESADIVVRWSSQARECSEGTEAGRTRTYAQLNTATNRGVIHKAEMVLLTRLPDRELSDVEIRKAYLHEVGHALGIAGHSSNRGDIMYFAVSNRGSTHLADRDIATINRLYVDYKPLTSVIGGGSITTKRSRS